MGLKILGGIGIFIIFIGFLFLVAGFFMEPPQAMSRGETIGYSSAWTVLSLIIGGPMVYFGFFRKKKAVDQ